MRATRSEPLTASPGWPVTARRSSGRSRTRSAGRPGHCSRKRTRRRPRSWTPRGDPWRDRVAAAVAIAEEEARTEAARVVNGARRRLVHRRAELASCRLDGSSMRRHTGSTRSPPEATRCAGLAHWGPWCGRGASAPARARRSRSAPATSTWWSRRWRLRPPCWGPCATRASGCARQTAAARSTGCLAARLGRARSAMACQVAATLGLGSGEAPGATAIPPDAAAPRNTTPAREG